MRLDDNTQRFLAILEKIPMFQRLVPGQALEVLRICRARSFADLQVLMEHGSKSTEMFILLSGELLVRASDGTTLATLEPITSVGEMGIITGQPRTATVIASGKVNVFEISRVKFEVLMKRFPDIGFVVFRNIITTLSARLGDTNQLLAQSQREIDRLTASDAVPAA